MTGKVYKKQSKYICNICHKREATFLRAIAGKHYRICDSEKCNFLSLLRGGLLKLHEIGDKK